MFSGLILSALVFAACCLRLAAFFYFDSVNSLPDECLLGIPLSGIVFLLIAITRGRVLLINSHGFYSPFYGFVSWGIVSDVRIVTDFPDGKDC